MIEAISPEHLQQAPENISAVGTSLGTSGGLAVLGWLFIRSKLDSIGTLWRKLDEVKAELAEHKLAVARDHATREELGASVRRLEEHFDKRFDALERKLEAK